MDKPQLRVHMELKGDEAGKQRTLSIGNPIGSDPNAELYARRSDLDVSFSVPRASLETLRGKR
jgi:hypothetical protein